MTRYSIVLATVLSLLGTPLVMGAAPAFAQDDEWSSSGSSGDRSVRDTLRDWIRENPEHREMLMDFLRDRRERRSEMMDRQGDRMERRERMRDHMSRMMDDDDEGGWRERVRGRIADRRENCFFITRSLRAADGDFMVLVRRRVCRD